MFTLVEHDPKTPINSIVKAFKGRSSRLFRKEFPHLLKLPTLWTHSYFYDTTGKVTTASITEYWTLANLRIELVRSPNFLPMLGQATLWSKTTSLRSRNSGWLRVRSLKPLPEMGWWSVPRLIPRCQWQLLHDKLLSARSEHVQFDGVESHQRQN